MRKLMLAAAAVTGLLAVTAVGASAGPTRQLAPAAAVAGHAPVTNVYYGDRYYRAERYDHRGWHRRWDYPRYAYKDGYHQRQREHGRWYDRY
jgi:hypothetical protein